MVSRPSYQAVIKYHPEVDILFRCRSRLADPAEINGINPVLHVMMEMNALGAVNDPEFPAARQAMERLRDEGLSEHASLCAIGRLISAEVYGALTQGHTDSARFSLRLSLLSTHPFRPPGRNEPCPCGSGLKFKKCCLPVSDAFTVAPWAGELDLGVGHYMLSRDLRDNPEYPLLCRLENRVQIAHYLERIELIDEALETLQENQAEAQRAGDQWAEGALVDLIQLCLNQRSLSSLGIDYCRRLLEMDLPGEGEARSTAQCDLADLKGRAEGFAEGESEYDRLIADGPGEAFLWYRKALYLIEHGHREEARAILAQVLSSDAESEYEKEVARWAREVLEDEFGADHKGEKRS